MVSFPPRIEIVPTDSRQSPPSVCRRSVSALLRLNLISSGDSAKNRILSLCCTVMSDGGLRNVFPPRRIPTGTPPSVPRRISSKLFPDAPGMQEAYSSSPSNLNISQNVSDRPGCVQECAMILAMVSPLCSIVMLNLSAKVGGKLWSPQDTMAHTRAVWFALFSRFEATARRIFAVR